MKILQDQQPTTTSAHGRQQPQHCLTAHRRRHVDGLRARERRQDRSERRKPRREVIARARLRRDQRQRLGQRTKGCSLRARHGAPTQHTHATYGRHRRRLVNQPRLADPSLADQEHQPATALLRSIERGRQHLHLVRPAHEHRTRNEHRPFCHPAGAGTRVHVARHFFMIALPVRSEWPRSQPNAARSRYRSHVSACTRGHTDVRRATEVPVGA